MHQQTSPRCRRLSTAAALLLAAVALLALPATGRAQWTPPDASGNTNYPNGKVGVGTASPATALEVGRNAGGSPTGVTITGGVAAGAAPVLYFNYADAAAGLKRWGVWGDFYGAFNVGTQPDALGVMSPKLSITNAGNVGVGTTNPQATLQVERDANGDASLHLLNNGGGANSRSVFLLGEAASNARYAYLAYYGANSTFKPNGTLLTGGGAGGLHFFSYGGANSTGGLITFNTAPAAAQGGNDAITERVRIEAGGNVGIGTASPNYRLDVQGGAVNASAGLCMAGDCKSSWSQVGGSSQWTTAGANLSYNSGNVGIGTASPAERLQVTSRVRLGNLMVGESRPAGATPAGEAVESLGGDLVLLAPPGRAIQFGHGGADPLVTISAAGDLTAAGAINAKYQDVAEWVPSVQKLQAGTVVVLDPDRANQVVSSTEAYDTKVAGVVSERPGIALGEGGEGKVLVATTGRVRVKVDATKAPVRIGDLLVTGETPGVAMRSEPVVLGGRKMHAPGTIIGKALEPLAGGVGEILVLLSLQ